MAITLRITPNLVEAGAGKFNSTRRYLRVGSGAFLPIPQGRTFDFTENSVFEGDMLAARYSVNGNVERQNKRFAGLQGSDSMNSGSYNAPVTLVKYE